MAVKPIMLAGLVLLLSAGCSSERGARPPSTVVVRESMNELERDRVPGTVDDVWAESMYDTVRVPGQLDPHNMVYRKAHNELVEIRPGRHQLVEYPNDRTVQDQNEGREAPPLPLPQ